MHTLPVRWRLMGGYFVLAAENSHPAQLYREPHSGIKLCFGWLGRTYWELEYS